MRWMLAAWMSLLCPCLAWAGGSATTTMQVSLRIVRAPEEMQVAQAAQTALVAELAQRCRRDIGASASAEWIASPKAEDTGAVKLSCSDARIATSTGRVVNIEF